MIIALIGRMASGKTTVAKRLADFGYPRFPQATTRPQRDGEVDGEDYIFLTEEQFLERERLGLFAESQTFKSTFGEWRYGSLKANYILDQNSCVVLNNFAVKQLLLNGYRGKIFIVWLDPPEEVLMRRALSRGDPVNEVARRCASESIEYQTIEVNHLYDLRIMEDKPVEYIVQDILDGIENWQITMQTYEQLAEEYHY